MRHLELEALIHGERAERVFENVLRWDRYPGLAPHVRSTTVHRTLPDTRGSSSWELYFRSGLLRWTEDEVFDREALTISYEQSEGDFEEFSGGWLLQRPGETGRGDDAVALNFTCRFDFGVDSLAGILDPIAERVIKETVAWAVTGMFENVTLRTETGTRLTAADAVGTGEG
ncbi:type II toxin-antitoxin system RatA family toxin [Streptomyces iconiensis]|uniref:SRPBCC family protein n=1 Tax=Streptomyces iconiensis TaxID=1384038 RepID=A0ABT7A3C7_9ACTN|nr:SRPBCC family protein [Streptomyces iconiensis]MDJ1135805.1 SRPBCC family protein [Streptomyces iconiensis]